MNNIPAPWNLKGSGYILLYRFPKDFSNQQAPEFLKGKTVPGFGSMMIVNYDSSDCGPYGELLLISGKYQYRQKKKHTISKIYVSSQSSVDNGRHNWGIPKELANFTFEPVDNQTEKITITKGDGTKASPILEATFSKSWFTFPVSTSLLPFPLVQQLDGKEFQTTFLGKGRGRFAKLTHITINAEQFPDLAHIKPIAIVHVSPFQITFPKAIIEPLAP
jgi:hypothetical protein